jgi:hypothetical protein
MASVGRSDTSLNANQLQRLDQRIEMFLMATG